MTLSKTKKIAISIALGTVFFIVLALCFWLWQMARPPPYIVPKTFSSQFNNFTAHENLPKFPTDLVFYDLNDRPATIDDFGKRFRLINFWATWCPPCLEELPTLKQLNSYKGSEDFIVMFVSLDFPDNGVMLRDKMQRRGITSVNSLYLKDYDIWEELGIKGLPVTILVDPRGRILYTMAGEMDWLSSDASRFIAVILND